MVSTGAAVFLSVGIFIIFLIILSTAVKIVREYERGVIFRLGRLLGAKGPGLFFIIPIFDAMVKMDLRTKTIDIPPQEVITRDNVTTEVNAVLYYRILDPEKTVTQVENYQLATSQIAQTTLRSVIGQAELDEILVGRDKLNTQIQQIIDEATDPWGIKVSIVEIKDVGLPREMQRAMATQAEAERTRRAKLIQADAEKQAAVKLAEAAEIIQNQEGTMYLRTLQTLKEATSENATTVVLPFPVEFLKALKMFSKD